MEVCFHPVVCPGYREKNLEWDDIRDPIFRTEPNLHSGRAESIFWTVFGPSSKTNLPNFSGLVFFPSPFLSEGRVRNKPSPAHEGINTCYCKSATPGNSTLINFTFLYTLFLSSNVRSFASFLLRVFFYVCPHISGKLHSVLKLFENVRNQRKRTAGGYCCYL